MNDWEYHALVLLNYLTTCAELVRNKPLTNNEMSTPFERHLMDLNTWNRRVGATLPQLINSQGGCHLWGKGEPTGMTALHYATQQGFPDVVDKLLSIPGICVNVRDFSGRTPLHLTFINRNTDRIITSLIKHGADFTIQDNTGGTPFLNAMLFLRDDWLVHMIFDHLVNYDIHQQDDKGFDLLRWAVECNCPLLVRKIMTRGGKPEVVDKKGRNQQDPLRQSLFLLATMAVLLLAARYFVPRIVEEIRYGWHRGELRAEYESGSEGLRNVSLDTLSRAYQMVTSTVGPSVVHIDVKQPFTPTDMKIQGRLIPLFQPQTDQGSGVIVASNGYVLTNRHVIDGGEEIYVTLGDGRRLNAAIIGTDKQTDLAVLKVDADDLIPIAWGDSDRCRVGSPVWAVGSPFGLDQTVTFGILSGKHRMVEDSTHYQDFMQSDVAVNPGNSGGPLVDARGTLVGINTAIVGESYQGVSFAVPSNVAKQVYERLKETGRVDRGWLGVRLSEVEDENLIGDNPQMRGAVVSGLTNENSPAALAGLKLGDHILTVDSQLVRDLPHLMRLIGGSLAGSDITLELVRQGKPLTVTVVLGARPDRFNQP